MVKDNVKEVRQYLNDQFRDIDRNKMLGPQQLKFYHPKERINPLVIRSAPAFARRRKPRCQPAAGGGQQSTRLRGVLSQLAVHVN